MLIMTKDGKKKIVADALVAKYEKEGWKRPEALAEAAETTSADDTATVAVAEVEGTEPAEEPETPAEEPATTAKKTTRKKA